MKRPSSLFTPEQSQKNVRERLVQELCDAKIQSAESLGPLPTPSRVFGLLGPRGTGKSTIIRMLRDPEYDGFPQHFLLLPEMDCSALPEEVVPGTALLVHLQTFLEERAPVHEQDPEFQAILQECDELAGICARTTSAFHELSLNLASSPRDYSHFMAVVSRDRLTLRRKVTSWLEKTLRLLRKQAFVIALDDFDLINAQAIQRWLFSLLDEMFQERLFFILTADFNRLEDTDLTQFRGIDKKTLRALINKFLPPENRIDIQPWNIAHDHDLVHFFHYAIPDSYRRDSLLTTPDRLAGFFTDHPIQKGLYRQLIPLWPRGLEDLFFGLNDHHQKSLGTEPDAREKCRRQREVLVKLAACRAESLLVRRLRKQDPAGWPRVLRFPKKRQSVEDWDHTVEIAAIRMNDQSQPFTALAQVTPDDVLESGPSDSWSSVPRSDDSGSVNTGGWRKPWDVSRAQVPFWAELLLNMGMQESHWQPVSHALRNRVHVLYGWCDLADRVRQAHFRTRISRSNLTHSLMTHQLPSRAYLTWIDASPERTDPSSGDLIVEIGWRPLLQALRGDRDASLSSLMASLHFDPTNLRFADPMTPIPRHVTALRVLPGELWALVLLVEGLTRCPWENFPTYQGWSIELCAVLAAALVHTAYAWGLIAAGILEEQDLTEPERGFLDAVVRKDPYTWLHTSESGGRRWRNRYEEELLSDVYAILNRGHLANLVVDREDALSEAAHAYLKGAVYLAATQRAEALHRDANPDDFVDDDDALSN